MIAFWNKQDSLTLPDGTVCAPEEVFERWPFSRALPTVIETSGPVTMAIDNLYILRGVYGVDEALGDDEALAAIIEKKNEGPPDDDATAFLNGMMEGYGDDE